MHGHLVVAAWVLDACHCRLEYGKMDEESVVWRWSCGVHSGGKFTEVYP